MLKNRFKHTSVFSFETKIVLFLLVLSVLFICGLIFIEQNENKKTGLIFQNKADEKIALVNKIVQLKGSLLDIFTLEFSTREEMLNFMETAGNQLLRFIIDESLPSFGVDAVWITDSDLFMLYSSTVFSDTRLRTLPVSQEELRTLVGKKSYFNHFFVETSAGLLEIRSAPIQSLSERKQKGPPRGYLFATRIWTPKYISELAKLTECSFHLSEPNGHQPMKPVYNESEESVTFTQHLKDWNGKPVKSIQARFATPLFGELNNTSESQFILLFVFAAVIILFLTMFESVRQWMFDKK